MFDLLKKTGEGLVIYKTPMLDAATCIVKNGEAEIVKAAKKSIDEMFLNMEDYFCNGQGVTLKFLKRRDSDSITFNSFNQFKVWLICMQSAASYWYILQGLKNTAKRKG